MNFFQLSNQRIDLKNNAFDFLRLFFAVMVVYGHSWTYGFGTGSEALKIRDMHGELAFGGFAVYGFFVISGFLITSSIFRSSNLAEFFGKRFARIMPGFWACLIVLATIIAPILYFINHGNLLEYFPKYGAEAYQYFWNNVTLEIKSTSIDDVLAKSKVNKLDDPFWSLIFELRAYILLAILWAIGVFKNKFLIFIPAAFFWFAYYGVTFIPGYRDWFNIWVGDWKIACLFSYFFVASAFYVWKDKISMDWKLFTLALISAAYFISIDQFAAIAPLAVTYGILYIATVLPLQNISKKIGDLSYGVYIYSAPIQIILTSAGFSKYGYWPYVVVSILLSLLAGYLSYNLVEKRFLVRKS
jgi:peptidoglycan/LPS O-acetylase OafA/YrhL